MHTLYYCHYATATVLCIALGYRHVDYVCQPDAASSPLRLAGCFGVCMIMSLAYQ